jgi:hypothetical protein
MDGLGFYIKVCMGLVWIQDMDMDMYRDKDLKEKKAPHNFNICGWMGTYYQSIILFYRKR